MKNIDNKGKIAILLGLSQLLALSLTLMKVYFPTDWTTGAWCGAVIGQAGAIVQATWRNWGLGKAIGVGTLTSVYWFTVGALLSR